MKFYKRFPGDITIKTGHLSPAEFGCYSRLLDHYYANDEPISADAARLICRAESKSDVLACDAVLSEFFTLDERGFSPAILPGEEQEANRWRRTMDVSSWQWWQLRQSVLKRDGGLCTYCSVKAIPFHCDHIVPLDRGGRSVLLNLTGSCRQCNSSKGSKLLSEWRK